MEFHRTTDFLGDGAHCHAIKSFLAEKPYEVIDWPGNSLEFNPLKKLLELPEGQGHRLR
jgi:hypothetical protein